MGFCFTFNVYVDFSLEYIHCTLHTLRVERGPKDRGLHMHACMTPEEELVGLLWIYVLAA